MPIKSLYVKYKECISTRKGKIYKKGINNKVKLVLYKTFNKNTEFEKYFYGIYEGTSLLFKFRSGTVLTA